VRDFLLLVIICGSLPVCFFQPFFGVLMWIWIAYFNPHRFTFDYMYDFPVAQAIAVPTLAGLIFHRKFNRPLFVRENVWMLVLWAWFAIVYINATHIPFFAGHVDDSKIELIRISKILLMTFVIMLVTTSEKRLKAVFLVTAFSFGIIALKSAIFGIFTGVSGRLSGPPDSFISENNAFGLALNMCIPIFYFLGRVESNRLLRRALNVGFVSCIICVILTYSRGGFLGLVAILTLLAMRSRQKVIGVTVLATIVLLLIAFAPASWVSRMQTLQQDGVDMSAQQRLVSWGTTWNFAMDYPLMGGSFYTLPDVEIFQKYKTRDLPGGFQSSGPHSIYFQILGDQGFVGFLIYFGLIAACFFTLSRLRRSTLKNPELQWISVYADIISTSLVAFLVSGAFLGFADFDLYFQMVACVCVLKSLYIHEAAIRNAPAQVPEVAFAFSGGEPA